MVHATKHSPIVEHMHEYAVRAHELRSREDGAHRELGQDLPEGRQIRCNVLDAFASRDGLVESWWMER